MKPSQALCMLVLLFLPVLISPKDTSGVSIIVRRCLGGGHTRSPFFSRRSHVVKHRSSDDHNVGPIHDATVSTLAHLNMLSFQKGRIPSAAAGVEQCSREDARTEAPPPPSPSPPAHARSRLVGGSNNNSSATKDNALSNEGQQCTRKKKRYLFKLGAAVSKLGSELSNVGIALLAMHFGETWLTVFGIGRLVQGRSKLVGSGLSNLGVGMFIIQVVGDAPPFIALIGLGQAVKGVGQLIEALQQFPKDPEDD